MTRKSIRLANLRRLVEELGTIAAVAAAAGTNEKHLSAILNGKPLPSGRARGIGESLAEKLEHGCLKPSGWLDIPPEVEPVAPALNAIESELLRLFRAASQEHRRAIIAVAKLNTH